MGGVLSGFWGAFTGLDRNQYKNEIINFYRNFSRSFLKRAAVLMLFWVATLFLIPMIHPVASIFSGCVFFILLALLSINSSVSILIGCIFYLILLFVFFIRPYVRRKL